MRKRLKKLYLVQFRNFSIAYQHLSITQKTYKLFDAGVDVRGIFLDIFKAFHKEWGGSTTAKIIQSVFWQIVSCNLSLTTSKMYETEKYTIWSKFFLNRWSFMKHCNSSRTTNNYSFLPTITLMVMIVVRGILLLF